ncbi:hypothetical protein [Amycolatopsis sp.]|uniref:hypothetical protein n=1 Tax=Amycolatopsis sp. TaxID=37632 RepID=UPI002C562C90|nr:hypothetical protein [Amycolatopsis sp.]HVV10452.1 hypothetical protein [Amycolatopsis sp.]
MRQTAGHTGWKLTPGGAGRWCRFRQYTAEAITNRIARLLRYLARGHDPAADVGAGFRRVV